MQCALNSSKAQLRFAYCALVLYIAFCFCGATILMFRAHLWLHFNIPAKNGRIHTCVSDWRTWYFLEVSDWWLSWGTAHSWPPSPFPSCTLTWASSRFSGLSFVLETTLFFSKLHCTLFQGLVWKFLNFHSTSCGYDVSCRKILVLSIARSWWPYCKFCSYVHIRVQWCLKLTMCYVFLDWQRICLIF